MRELNLNETNSVAAGAVPLLLGILAFEWANAERIQTSIEGFLEGFSDGISD